jgi:FOG: Ankyrin repeat
VDIQKRSTLGNSALYLAAQNGHSQCLHTLLEHQANPNLKSKAGWSALHIAAQNGHADCVKLLLHKGADLRAVSTGGMTALHLAAHGRHSECVHILIKKVSPEFQDFSSFLLSIFGFIKSDVFVKSIIVCHSIHNPASLFLPLFPEFPDINSFLAFPFFFSSAEPKEVWKPVRIACLYLSFFLSTRTVYVRVIHVMCVCVCVYLSVCVSMCVCVCFLMKNKILHTFRLFIDISKFYSRRN